MEQVQLWVALGLDTASDPGFPVSVVRSEKKPSDLPNYEWVKVFVEHKHEEEEIGELEEKLFCILKKMGEILHKHGE